MVHPLPTQPRAISKSSVLRLGLAARRGLPDIVQAALPTVWRPVWHPGRRRPLPTLYDVPHCGHSTLSMTMACICDRGVNKRLCFSSSETTFIGLDTNSSPRLLIEPAKAWWKRGDWVPTDRSGDPERQTRAGTDRPLAWDFPHTNIRLWGVASRRIFFFHESPSHLRSASIQTYLGPLLGLPRLSSSPPYPSETIEWRESWLPLISTTS
jgi:hypothetical protein